MKTVGLIGGMSWESTATYYKLINQVTNKKLGGHHSAKICLVSVDFHQIEQLQHTGEWEQTAEILGSAALSLQKAGADFFLICTNTMHKVADEVAGVVSIPLLHIADATGRALAKDNLQRVGLLGTRFTMEQAFYKDYLINKYGLDVLIPAQAYRQRIHQIIFDELCHGIIKESSRREYLAVIDSMIEQGAQGIILGCTEIAMLLDDAETNVPLYDTTRLHAEEAVAFAL